MFMFLMPIAVFILGLIIGSFLNCVIWRLYKKESFLKGRSYCPECGHKLRWYDLVPVLSFVLLRGKCRYCKKPISWQYPLVEISTGLIFLFIFDLQSSTSNLQSLIKLSFLLIISCFFIIIFVYDFRWYLIPDKVIYPAIVITFLYQLSKGLGFWILKPVLSAILASAFFAIIVLVSRGKWMGRGDIKLAFLMGLFLGFPNIVVALFLAFLIGAIIGTGLILLKKKGLKSEIPFGPFLATGTFIALFWGGSLVNWYLNFIL